MSTPPTVHGLLASLVRGRPRAGTGGVAFPGAAVQRAPPAGAALTHARDDENRLQAENRDDESPPKRRKTAVALDLEDDDDDDESDPEDCDQGGAGTEVGATAAADVNDDDGAGRQGGSPGTHLAALLGRRSPGAQAGGLFARPQNASAAADGGLRTVREENEDQAEADDNGHAVAGSLRARPGATSEADEQPAPPGAEDAGATEDAGAPLASALRRYMSTIARETHEALVAIVNDAELSMLLVRVSRLCLATAAPSSPLPGLPQARLRRGRGQGARRQRRRRRPHRGARRGATRHRALLRAAARPHGAPGAHHAPDELAGARQHGRHARRRVAARYCLP